MTYATVMVSLALDRSNDACLEIAGQLAKRFNACAIGITAGEFSPPLYFTAGEQAQQVIDRGHTVPGREFDLTQALARALHMQGTQTIHWRFAR